jgi:hypothetical protein
MITGDRIRGFEKADPLSSGRHSRARADEKEVKNDEFRRVLYTAKHCQLVVMALKPKDAVVHQTRQNAEADNEHFDGKTTE